MLRRIALLLCCYFSSLPAFGAPCPSWSAEQANTELHALSTQIGQWNDSYHRQGQSPIADELYDQTLARLREWQMCFPQVAGAEPATAPPTAARSNTP